jgi:tetratricopeptide (TPR) repeat protein
VFPHVVHRADRFLYLPLVGLAVAVAAGLRPLGKTLNRPPATALVTAAAVVGLLLLAAGGARQLQTWRTSASVWENCVRADPDHLVARLALGEDPAAPGQPLPDVPGREAEMRLDFDTARSVGRAALGAAPAGEEDPRRYEAAVWLAKRACELSGWEEPAYFRVLAMAYSGFAEFLVNRGEFARAVKHYEWALLADPECRPALFQLAAVLATCKDRNVREPEKAVALAERACALEDRPDAGALVILAAAYAQAWQFDKAAATAEEAAKLAEAAGAAELAKELRRRSELYRKRVPPE